MRACLLAILLTLPAFGQDSAELLWAYNVNGVSVCSVSRKADGTLSVNIPDKYVYQKVTYWNALYHSGRGVQITKYDVSPSLKDGQQATHTGLRDQRRFESPMRHERTYSSAGGSQVEVYSDGGSVRLIIYRIAIPAEGSPP